MILRVNSICLIVFSVALLFTTSCMRVHEADTGDTKGINVTATIDNELIDMYPFIAEGAIEEMFWQSVGEGVYAETNPVEIDCVMERDFKMFTDRVEQTLRDIQRELRLIKMERE